MQTTRISRLSIQLFLLDAIAIALGLALATFLRLTLPFGKDIPAESVILPWPVYAIALFSLLLSLMAYGAYDPQKTLRWYSEAQRVLGGTLIGIFLMAGVLYLTFREVSRLQFLYIFLVTTFLILCDRALMRVFYRMMKRSRPGWHKRVLILGAGELGRRVAKMLLEHSRWGYSVVGYLDDDPEKRGQTYESFDVLGGIDEMERVVEGRHVDEVWVALPLRSHQRLRAIVEALDPLPVRINIVPDYFSLALVRAAPDVVGGIPVIGLREPVLSTSQAVIKRSFDLVIGALLLLLFSPLMLLIALAIKLDSSGPVLFRQKRAGENGRLFDMYKFRTMVADAEAHQQEVLRQTEAGEVIHKSPSDPRVTRVGAFLRRYSLDELPQFFNVIKGDMSLVGPRPEMPWLVDRYDPWQRKRFAVPQGITGWWQINGRSEKPMHLNTEFDLYYVYNYSLWLDIRILLRTPIVVIRGEGAF